MKKLLLLFCLLCVAALLLSLAACGRTAARSRADDDEDGERSEHRSDRDGDDSPAADPDEAAGVCEAFFDAYTSLDGETAGALLAGMGEHITFGTLSGAMAERMTFNLGDTARTDAGITISAEITVVDLAAVFQLLPEDISSQEDALMVLTGLVEAEDAPVRDFQVEVVLIDQSGEWRLQMTAELSDAIMGGYNTMLEELLMEVAE